MTLVTMVQSIIPALAPLVGGLLVALLDWRAEFLFCAAYGRIGKSIHSRLRCAA